MSTPALGEVITFYSYKGGVGRSMALANVAVQLAQRGKTVLAIDFDLEAPGLHRYFSIGEEQPAEPPTNTQPVANAGLGVIEFFVELRSRLDLLQETPPGSQVASTEPVLAEGATEPHLSEGNAGRGVVNDILDRGSFIRSRQIQNPNGSKATLSLMAAGRFDAGYASRVRSFDWQSLYDRYPHIIEIVATELARRYEYVLIDSRTGTTDIANICTVLFPEKLVLVFVPNEQSLNGALEIGRQAVVLRKSLDDLRPLPLFPLISRVENAETLLQKQWIDRAREGFEAVFKTSYGVTKSLSRYFDAVEIPHRSFYAYGESIACERERVTEVHSLAAAFHLFVDVVQCNNAIDAQVLLGARLVAPSVAQKDAARAEQEASALKERVAAGEAREKELRAEVEGLRTSKVRGFWWASPFVVVAVAGAALGVLLWGRRPTQGGANGLEGCLAARLASYKRDPSAQFVPGRMAAANLPLLVDPSTRAIIDACVKERLHEPVAWSADVKADVTSDQRPVEGELVQSSSNMCVTNAEGLCFVRVEDVKPEASFKFQVQRDGEELSTVVPAEKLAAGVHLDVHIDGGPDADAVVADASSKPPLPSTLRDPSESRADCLVRSIVNMIEGGSPDKDYFIEGLSQARTTEVFHRTGLYNLLQRYMREGGPRSSDLQQYLARVDRKDATIKSDPGFIDLLSELSTDPVMVRLSFNYLNEGWFKSSQATANQIGVKTRLGVALLYDMSIEGSLNNTLVRAEDGGLDGGTEFDEKAWVRHVLRETTRDPVASRAFDGLVASNNWELAKPISVKGVPFVPACPAR